MTRIPSTLFALLLGLLAGAAAFLLLYYTGDMDTRLTWSGIWAGGVFAVSWFMASRVRTKSSSEQLKQRLLAFGLLLVLLGGGLFVNYKQFEESFISACANSGGEALCECIEDYAGPSLYLAQVRHRPAVALDRMSVAEMLRQARLDNRAHLEEAARTCAANPQGY